MTTVFEEVKERVDLVELIGRSLPLKKTGSYWKGLCPFHQEKTPSFYIRPATRRWHCFGCGKTGDAFDWLIEHENYGYRDALVYLAQQAGVTLDSDQSKIEQRRRIFEILEHAQRFYQDQISTSRASEARSYLRQRGLDDATIRRFGIGYAPRGNRLHDYLREHAVSDEDMHAAGVLGLYDDSTPVDFLRNRIVFPIRDTTGRVNGFGGRVTDNSQRSMIPKYINTRDTLVFHKQSALYGIDQARGEITTRRQAVIVEGYLDVIAAHQHGHANVVATLGTAVSDNHLRQLSSIADEIVFALDADSAGQSATLRSIHIADESLRGALSPVVGPERNWRQFAREHPVKVKVLQLPEGRDPDKTIRLDGGQLWSALIDGAMPVVDFALHGIVVRPDLNTATGKAQAAAEVADVLAWVSNPVERAHYIQRAAEILDVNEIDVREIVRRKILVKHARDVAVSPVDLDQSDTHIPRQWDEYALALLIVLPKSGADLEFAHPESRALARRLSGRSSDPVPDELQPLANKIGTMAEHLSNRSESDLRQEYVRARQQLRRQRLFFQRAEIMGVLSDTDDTTERVALAHAYNTAVREIMSLDA